MLLKGKTAVLTGCNRGIGKALLEVFANNGANIWACVRQLNDDFIDNVKAVAKESDVIITPVHFDLTDAEQVKQGVKIIKTAKNPVDILVNNAASIYTALFQMTSIEKMKELFEINYFSSMQIAKGFCDRRVSTNEGGSIVFISSIASIRGNSGIVGYSASKGALNAAVKSMAVEMARLKIRVNAILPGFVMTGMTKKWKRVYDEKYINQINNKYPLGIGKVSDVVGPILFLISDNAKWITGTCISVDGGGSL